MFTPHFTQLRVSFSLQYTLLGWSSPVRTRTRVRQQLGRSPNRNRSLHVWSGSPCHCAPDLHDRLLPGGCSRGNLGAPVLLRHSDVPCAVLSSAVDQTARRRQSSLYCFRGATGGTIPHLHLDLRVEGRENSEEGTLVQDIICIFRQALRMDTLHLHYIRYLILRTSIGRTF